MLGKEITCTFAAQTAHVEKGETVDYYWTFQDLAALLMQNLINLLTPIKRLQCSLAF